MDISVEWVRKTELVPAFMVREVEMRERGSVVEPTLPDALMVRVGTVIVGRVVVVARPSGLALMVPPEVRVRVLVPV